MTILYNIAEKCSRTGTNLYIADRHLGLNAQGSPPHRRPEWWTIVSIPSFTLYNDDPLSYFKHRWTMYEFITAPRGGTQVLVRIRLLYGPSTMVFDTAHTLDPCLPRICRAAAFTCDRVCLNDEYLQPTMITQILMMHQHRKDHEQMPCGLGIPTQILYAVAGLGED